MLCDLVMKKLEEAQGANIDEKMETILEPKVVKAYRSIATLLKTYSSGKLPKAFKVIPMVANWEDLLFLTKPE